MTSTAITTVTLIVADIPAALRFYRALGIDPADPCGPLTVQEAPGAPISHTMLTVTVDDLGVATAALDRIGARWEFVAGAVETSDPDGNVVVVEQREG